MRTSAWLAWPVLAISTSALVIHSPPTDLPHDVVAVAGSTAITNVTELSNTTKSLLEIEYETLEVLKHKLHQLHHEVLRKERDILHIINQDFKSCAGVTCYLQTALKKAPDFYELLKTHFRHSAKNATGSDPCFWPGNSSWLLTEVSSDPDEDHKQGPSSHSPFEVGGQHSPPPPPHFDHKEDQDHKPPSIFGGPPPPPPPPHHTPSDFTDDEPPHHRRPGHHGPPLPHHDPHEHDHDISPSYHGHKPHHERPPFHMPHPAPRPRYYNLILATTALLTTLIILAALFKGLRIYCSNPRVRADRAARREECRTKREYRRAACQHRLRQVLSRFRRRERTTSTDDYEEKRAMLRVGPGNTIAVTASTPNSEDHIVGSNIASLRRAHELVGQLMLAEEGRSPSFSFAAPEQQPHPPFQTVHQQHTENGLPSSSRSIHSIHTTTTLPAYIPPPPRYSQELACEIHDVVDGFRYTPTHSGGTPSETTSPSTFIFDDSDIDHQTHGSQVMDESENENENDIDAGTESSVVDCISRMSLATETEADAEIMRRQVIRKGSFELAGDRYIGRFD